MAKGAFFLFLLTLVEVTSSSIKDGNHEKQDGVLIRSKRRWVLSTIDLVENKPGPYPIEVTRMFNDKKGDNTVKFRIKGDGVTKEPFGLFTIDEDLGTVFVHRPIDREVYPIFHVDFDVLDRQTGETLDKTLSFDVEIKDVNDNKPEFTPSTIHSSVPENSPDGTVLATIKARDNDQMNTPNSQFVMRVVSQEPVFPPFSLRNITGDPTVNQLILMGCLNYDIAKTYKVLVEAKDQGKPALSSTATVLLDITDSNTHLPEFSSAYYKTEVMEMESNKEILRIGVVDKDAPNTPASKAVFSILRGNEDINYEIKTDPKTNEGVLSVVKGKDFEKSKITDLEIEVKNEDKFFQCVNGKFQTVNKPKLNTTKVAVKVIDVNDPPVFKKTTEKVYRNENEDPGDVLFVPEITDEDSDIKKIRYELVQDKANLVSVDPKTGKITTVQKIDRESKYVENGTYTVVVQAIDDGKPPATGTCTVVIYVGDKNDNAPNLTSNNLVMCGNKVNRVSVAATDLDDRPYSSPFTFSLGGEEALKELWKLDPTTGENTSLISLTVLPYGNYSVPLKMQDQQAMQSEEVLHVVVCECTEGNVCRKPLPFSSRLGPAAIGLLFAGILLLALVLLLCFSCNSQSKNFQHIPLHLQDEGTQTLVKYNMEGGGSIYKPQYIPPSNNGLTEGTKTAFAPYNLPSNNGLTEGMTIASAPFQYSSGTFQELSSGRGVMSMPYHNRSTVRRERGSLRNGSLSQSFSLARTERSLAEQIERKISGFPEELNDYPEYSPYQYEYEGGVSDRQSLDQLTVSNLGDNLDFLQNLGPKFTTLGGICQQSLDRRNVRL